MSDKVSITTAQTSPPGTKLTVEESLKLQSRKRKQANLKPFVPGQVSIGGKVQTLLKQIRSLTGDGKAIAEYWLSVLQDPDAKPEMRMRASENLARCAWPALAPSSSEETNRAEYQTVDAEMLDRSLD